jgi:hypothetical protein
VKRSLLNSKRVQASAGAITFFLLLLWPAVINGQPFLFYDTFGYMRGTERIAESVTGWRSEWLDYPQKKADDKPSESFQEDRKAGNPSGKDNSVVLLGRSVYYGAILLFSQELFLSFWPALLLQSACVCACVFMTINIIRRNREGDAEYWPVVAGAAILTVATPVSYFASYMMPDIYAALSILALGCLVSFWRTLSGFERGFWVLFIFAGCIFHSATLLIVAGLVLMSALSRLLGAPISWHGIGTSALAVAAAISSEVAYSQLVKHETGHAPVRPPFVTARLIADGPGYAYLKRHCPKSDFVLCRHLESLPLESDTLLWGSHRGAGLFLLLPPDERRKLAREQTRFAMSVLADRPVEVIRSSLAASWRQLRMIGLGEFNYDPKLRRDLALLLVPRELRISQSTAAYAGRMPVRPTQMLSKIALVLAVLSIGIGSVSYRWKRKAWPPETAFITMIVAGLLLNAIVCGALSTPHERYQARVIWLLPLLALALPRRTITPAMRTSASLNT